MKASKKQVFISAPMSLDWDTVMKFKLKLLDSGAVVKHWDRHSKYSQCDLDESDAVLFLLPRNQFRCDVHDMPTGLKVEFANAYAQGKSLFIGYITATGSYNIYDTKFYDGKFEGISGTANDIYETLREHTSIASDDTAFLIEDWPGSIYDVKNPCAEIELPKAQRVYATTIPNLDYVDECLILML